MLRDIQLNDNHISSLLIVNIDAIKTYTNAKGDGALFNTTFEDRNGDQIRATLFSTPQGVREKWQMFNDVATKNKAVRLTNVKFKKPNPKYSSSKIEMQMTDRSIISIMEDTFQRKPLVFTPINELKPHKTVHVRGVITEVKEQKYITTKASSRQSLQKIVLSDPTGSTVLTIWSPTLQLKRGDIIECLQVRVNVYRDIISIQTTVQGKLYTVECDQLKTWFHGKPAIRSPLPVIHRQYTTLSSIAARTTPGTSYGIFTMGSVNHTWNSYPSDPETRQKVVKRGDNWYNEKTQKFIVEPQYRFLMTVSLMDSDSNLNATMFDDVMSKLLNISCNDFVERKEKDQCAILSTMEFKEYVCAIETKRSSEGLLRHSIVNAESLRDEKICEEYT